MGWRGELFTGLKAIPTHIIIVSHINIADRHLIAVMQPLGAEGSFTKRYQNVHFVLVPNIGVFASVRGAVTSFLDRRAWTL